MFFIVFIFKDDLLCSHHSALALALIPTLGFWMFAIYLKGRQLMLMFMMQLMMIFMMQNFETFAQVWSIIIFIIEYVRNNLMFNIGSETSFTLLTTSCSLTTDLSIAPRCDFFCSCSFSFFCVMVIPQSPI